MCILSLQALWLTWSTSIHTPSKTNKNKNTEKSVSLQDANAVKENMKTILTKTQIYIKFTLFLYFL